MIARWALVLVTALVLQVGVAAQFPVAGVVPDLMVLVAVGSAMAGGPERGAIVGFWSGLVYDLARDGRLGLSAAAFALAAFGVGSLLVSVLRVRRLMAMVVIAAGSAAGELLFAVGGELFGEHSLSSARLWTIVGVVAGVNGLLSPLALRASRWAEGPQELSPAMIEVVDG